MPNCAFFFDFKSVYIASKSYAVVFLFWPFTANSDTFIEVFESLWEATLERKASHFEVGIFAAAYIIILLFR